MMSFRSWFAFALLMTAIAYTPGPMTMFSMSSSVRNGFYRTLPAIAGGSFAYLTQMVVVYLGLGVIVQETVLVFNTIKWAGVFVPVHSCHQKLAPVGQFQRFQGHCLRGVFIQAVFSGIRHRHVQP